MPYPMLNMGLVPIQLAFCVSRKCKKLPFILDIIFAIVDNTLTIHRHQKACLENSKDGRIDVFQNTIWLLKELVKWTNKQPG